MPSTEQKLGRLQESNQHLGNFNRLNSIFAEDGYLFFRGVLEGIEQVKLEFIRALQRQGAVKPGVSDPIWTGSPLDQIDDNELYGSRACAELFESAHNMQVFEKIFGEPVFVFKSPTVRYALPDDPEHVSPPHQDYFFVRINQSFRTFWIPLMDIDEHVGGLAIAPEFTSTDSLITWKRTTSIRTSSKGGNKWESPYQPFPNPGSPPIIVPAIFWSSII